MRHITLFEDFDAKVKKSSDNGVDKVTIKSDDDEKTFARTEDEEPVVNVGNDADELPKKEKEVVDDMFKAIERADNVDKAINIKRVTAGRKLVDNEISKFFDDPGFGQNDFSSDAYSKVNGPYKCAFFRLDKLDDKDKEKYRKLFGLGQRIRNEESSTESNEVTSSSTVGKGEYMLPVIYKDVRKNISKGDDTMVADPEPFANQNNVQIEVKTAGSPFKFAKDYAPQVSYNEEKFKECVARALVAYIKSRTFKVEYQSILLLIFDNTQGHDDYTGFLCLNCGQVGGIDDKNLYEKFMKLIEIVNFDDNEKIGNYNGSGFCIGTNGEKILVKLSKKFYENMKNESNSTILNFGNFVLNENL